jgi:hypothetical protein
LANRGDCTPESAAGRARLTRRRPLKLRSLADTHGAMDHACRRESETLPRNRHAPSAEETCRQPCSFALLRSIRSNDRLGESAVAAFLRRHTSRRRRARRRSRVCGASPSRLVRGRARGTRVWWARGEASNRDWIGLSRLPRARSCRNSNNRAPGTRGTPCRRGSPRSSPRRRAGT